MTDEVKRTFACLCCGATGFHKRIPGIGGGKVPCDACDGTGKTVANPACKACHGSGKVVDWVPRPFGPGNVAMESVCECVPED